MKKMNNKGFLLAESLVVSTFVLTVLILLFVQFKSLFNGFEDSYNTNTVEGIYNLNTMKKYILTNENSKKPLKGQFTNYLTVVQNGECNNTLYLGNIEYCRTLASGMNLKTLILTKSDTVISPDGFNKTFSNFIKKIDFNKPGQYRLIGQFGEENNYTYATIVYGSVE